MQEFSLSQSEYIELCSLLKVTGLCESGAVAKSVISNGEVVVDGKVETRKRCKIKKDQIVLYNSESVKVV